MTSDSNKFNYFSYYSLTKFNAVKQNGVNKGGVALGSLGRAQRSPSGV